MPDGSAGHAASAPPGDERNSGLRRPGTERGDVVRVVGERDGGRDQAGDSRAFAVDGARAIIDPEGTAKGGRGSRVHGRVKQGTER